MAKEVINIRYHLDDGFWWAESPDMKIAAGDTDLEEAKALAKGAVRLALGSDVTIAEWVDPPSALIPLISRSASRGEDVKRRSPEGEWPEPSRVDFSYVTAKPSVTTV